MTTELAPNDRKRVLATGLAWNTLYQVFNALLSFGAMLLLVRIIPPGEYGRAGAVSGLLAVLNAVGCQAFIAQALQLPEGSQPDWTSHWSVGWVIQSALFAGCQAIAGLAWFFPTYAPLASLLHVAALGLLLTLPHQLATTMLLRELDFRRLRIASAGVTLAGLVTSLGLGLWLRDEGAWAIVLGTNVCNLLPLSVYLFFVRRWHPEGPWFRLPNWRAYRAPFQFGAQSVGSGLLSSARGVLETTVLSATVGFGPMGLLNRANALFATTIGRCLSILTETGYPILPRSAADATTFARHATMYLQGAILVALPGSAYLCLEGPSLSRLIYGAKWIAADPLLAPGAVIGAGMGLFLASSQVLLAANRLRSCFLLSVVLAAWTAPAVVVTCYAPHITVYAWALAAGQSIAALAAIIGASQLLVRGWGRLVLTPPMAATLAACGVWRLSSEFLDGLPLFIGLIGNTAAFTLGFMLALRTLFPSFILSVLTLIPGNSRLKRWFRLGSLESLHR